MLQTPRVKRSTLLTASVRQFTKAQMRNFFHTMKALTSYDVSATLIVIENRNNRSLFGVQVDGS